MIRRKYKTYIKGDLKIKIFKLNGINRGEYFYDVEFYERYFKYFWFQIEANEAKHLYDKRFRSLIECQRFIISFLNKH